MIYYNKNFAKNLNFKDNNFFVVLDFDKTITTRDSANSWAVFNNEKYFCEGAHNEIESLSAYYVPIEINYDLPLEERKEKVIEWYTRNINVFFRYNLTEEILYNCIEDSNLEFRDGIKELLEYCHDNNIYVIIVSAGIKNVIEEFLEKQDCVYDNIYILSNKIEFEDGKMLEFKGHMIHTFNKNMNSLPADLKHKLESKESILLVGDLIEDIGIVNEKDLYKTLTVGMLESKVEENLDVYQEKYDVVLTEDDATFTKVMEIIGKV